MVINDTKVTYKDYKNTYLNFAANNAIEGPLSIESIDTIVWNLNNEFLDREDETIEKIENSHFLYQDITTTDYLQKAVDEVKNYNINSYYKEQTPIKLSDAIALESQKQVVVYLEKLLEDIRKLPQDEAINSYIELRDIIYHKNTEDYKKLSDKQQKIIESINLPVAANLYDYRKNAKQYKISQ